MSKEHNISRVIEGVRVTGTYIVENGILTLTTAFGTKTVQVGATKADSLAYIMLHELFEDARHKDNTTH